MAQAKAKTKAQELDLIAVLEKDHFEVEKLFQEFERSDAADQMKRQDIVRRAIRELMKHAIIEEELLYPVVRESVPDGAALVAEGIEEHQQVEETLTTLDGLFPDMEALEPEFLSVVEDTRHHIEEEENEMFPRLRDSVDAERLRELGAAARIMKRTAPTRPHPSAPNTPPGNVIVGLPAGMIDRARDMGAGVVKMTVGTAMMVVGKAWEIGRSMVKRMTG